jgi:hypothetical protein
VSARHEPELSYPVIVEITEQHVVWIPAENAAEAAKELSDDPDWYEQVSNKTQHDIWHEVRRPDSWDMRTPLIAITPDAHIHAYHSERARRRLEEQRAACAAENHVNGLLPGRPAPYCRTCGRLPGGAS